MTTTPRLQPEADLPERSGTSYRDSSLYQGVRFIRSRWRQLGLWTFVGFVIGAALSFALAPRFEATARVALPPTPSQLNIGALSSLSAWFGGSAGGGARYSPEFVMAIVESRNVVDSLLKMYPTAEEGHLSQTLAQYLMDEDSLTPRQYDDAQEIFTTRVGADLDVRTGIVQLSFWDTDPLLAATTLQSLLDEANNQLIAFQRNYAVSRRDYLAERVAEQYELLAQSEGELAEFREANREANSPLLQLEAERLSRRVGMALESYMALQTQLDAAELEVRSDIPELMIVESPQVPVRKSFPSRRRFALGFALLALIVYGVITAVRDGSARGSSIPQT